MCFDVCIIIFKIYLNIMLFSQKNQNQKFVQTDRDCWTEHEFVKKKIKHFVIKKKLSFVLLCDNVHIIIFNVYR